VCTGTKLAPVRQVTFDPCEWRQWCSHLLSVKDLCEYEMFGACLPGWRHHVGFPQYFTAASGFCTSGFSMHSSNHGNLGNNGNHYKKCILRIPNDGIPNESFLRAGNTSESWHNVPVIAVRFQTNTLMCWQFFFVELANIKFQENPFSGSPVVACGQTDIVNLKGELLHFSVRNAPKNV
jgi:hypothetical protein